MANKNAPKSSQSKPKSKPAPAPVAAVAAPPPPSGFVGRLLNGIERLGNKVPHPVIMFLYLIAAVILLSAILSFFNVSVTQEIAVPVSQEAIPYDLESGVTAYELEDADLSPDYEIETETLAIQSLLSIEGIRFIFTSFVPNFAGFTVVAVVIIAMLGVGIAEQAGMMDALIRKLVEVAPKSVITYAIVFIGIISSIATDAGYLILVPLSAVAFLKLGRHPLAGIAAGFAAVGGVFAVNVLIAPLDAMLTEITNESIQLVNPTGAISITANIFFAIASTLLMTIVVSLITEKIVEPRLGTYNPSEASDPDESATPVAAVSASAEAKGLRYALYYFLVATGIVALLALIPGAPLRRPIPGEGSSPLLDSIIFIISLLFLAAGVGYGRGANTLKGRDAIIAAATKTISGLGGLLLLFLIISQFIGQFNYTNMPQVLAIGMADLLERANIGAVPLLIGFIIVIMLLDIIIPNSIPKWAIFAPIFVPLFINLGVAPQTVLAAYRVGDSPLNVVTPLMVYLPFTVLVVQRYKKSAGIGSLISLMLPYVLIISVIWIVFFVLWFVFNVPLGPGYPAQL